MLKQVVSILTALLLTLWLLDSAQAADPLCEAGPLSRVHERLTSVQDQIQLVDYPAALATLEKTELDLPCVNELVPAQVLGRMFVYRGLTMFYLGNPESARVAFLRALAVDPATRWDTRYGQRPREAFLDARESSLGQPPQTLRCPLLVKGVQVYLNGRELAQGETATLTPGKHLLQVRWADGRWEGSFFEISAGVEIPLPVPSRALLPDRNSRASDPGRTDPTAQPKNPPTTRPPKEARPSTPRAVDFYQPKLRLTRTIAFAGLGVTAAFAPQFWYTSSRLKNPGLTSEQIPRYYSWNVTTAIVTDVAMATSLISGGLSFYYSRQLAKAKGPGPDSAALLLPYFDGEGAGLALQGTF